MTIEKNELKSMLEEFRTNVEKAIVDKTKEVSDKSSEEINNLKEKLAAAEKALEDIKEQQSKSFGLPGVDLEKNKFSWGKYYVGLFRNFLAGKGEVSSDEAKKYWDTEASFENRVCKDYIANDGSSGGFLVPPEIYNGDIIDTVYANTAVMKMPILRLTGLKSDIPIPVDAGNLNVQHVSETGAPSETDSEFDLVWLRPKKLATYVRISRRLLYQTNNAIEMIVKGKMALDAAVKMSYGTTVGKGAEKEPRGIMTYSGQMSGSKTISTNGRRWTIDDLASQLTALAKVNELRDTASYGSIMRPEVLWAMLREKTEMYSGQAARKGQPIHSNLILDKGIVENATRLKIESTTQIPYTTCGSSTTCSKVVTGDWSKFCVATFRDPEFRLSEHATDASGNSAFLKDEIFMMFIHEYDCACLRPQSFTAFDGAETDEANW